VTENRDDSTFTPQIDPAILGSLPSGANSVFALSAERFTAKILLDVAISTLVGSTAANFSFDTTGLVISNNADLPWREITLEDGSKVTPVVPADGLKIRVVDRYIELEFTGVHFDVPGWPWPGHKIATIDFKQQVFLELVAGKNAQGIAIHSLIARNVDPDSTNAQAIKDDLPTITGFVVNVGFDQTAITFQDAMIGIAIVLSALTIGLAGFSASRWIIRSQQLAQDAANAAANGGGGVAMNVIYSAPPRVAAQQAGNAVNAAAGGAAVAAGGGGAAAGAAGVAAGGILFVTKVAIGTTVAAVLAGIGTAAFWSIWGVSTARDLADGVVDNLAAEFTVEALLTEAFKAYDWTGTANNWAVVDARLAGSLLIYGKLS
jgi:hypothetical protein